MSSGGGSKSDGGGDMQVSGAEAAYSTEKGISTYSDTQNQRQSYNQDNNVNPVGSSFYDANTGPTIGYGNNKVDPNLAKHTLGADTSTVGIMQRDSILEKDYEGNSLIKEKYSNSEIEKGYTDEGKKLSQVGNGKYMTKEEMYSTGLIQKNLETGEDEIGRYKVNENTGELERTDKPFKEHWEDAPEILKYSPTLRLLYASGQNIGEWMKNKNFSGYNEAGLRGKLGNAVTTQDSDGSKSINTAEGLLSKDNERNIMTELAPEAPHIVSGTQRPTDSPAANWYKSLGTTSTNNNQFSFAAELAAAKIKQANILGTPSSVGWLAVHESPFYNWLKTNSLDKGIL